jgi:hypothetical protein
MVSVEEKMNERITELMIEAGKTIPGDKHIDADFCDKFAYFIIQECVQVCNDLDTEYEGEDVLAIWCADAIKRHFGVK